MTDEQMTELVTRVVMQLKQSPELRGPAGADGAPGKDAPPVDMDEIVRKVIENFPPFQVTRIYVDENGSKHVVKTGEVTPGGKMTLYDGPGSEDEHRRMLGLPPRQ